MPRTGISRPDSGHVAWGPDEEPHRPVYSGEEGEREGGREGGREEVTVRWHTEPFMDQVTYKTAGIDS